MWENVLTFQMFEGLSSILILCILIVWFTRQVIQATREGKSSSASLTESTITMLAKEQKKTAELNDKVDHLYADNRLLRSEVHTLKTQHDDLTVRYKTAMKKIERMQSQLNNMYNGHDYDQ
jgi:uncharacterized protein YlxW (UPF0749 family)